MVIAVKTHKIAYMAVPKSACTSVKAGLAQTDPEVSVDLDVLNNDAALVHSLYQTRRFRLHRWREYEGWWRFAVVRDPLKRLMSVYSDIVADRQQLRNSRKLRREGALLPMDPDPDFFFQHLSEYMKAASSVKHHALPVRLFIGPIPHLFDRIYKIEELPVLADDLSKKVGAEITIPRYNKSSSQLLFSDLNAKTRSSLDDYLDQEYKSLEGIYERHY